MSGANFLETAMLDHIFTDPAFTPSATPHVTLCSAAPVETDTGTTITEVVYTGMARQAVAAAVWDAASAANPSTKTNGSQINFPEATGGSDTATHFAIVSALTVGDLYFFGMLATGQGTCFFDASDDIVDAPAHDLVADDRVVFLSENMPTGIDPDVNYWIIAGSLTTDQFQFSTTMGGGAVNFTTDGFGRFGQTSWLAISNQITPQFGAGALVVSMS